MQPTLPSNPALRYRLKIPTEASLGYLHGNLMGITSEALCLQFDRLVLHSQTDDLHDEGNCPEYVQPTQIFLGSLRKVGGNQFHLVRLWLTPLLRGSWYYPWTRALLRLLVSPI